MIKKTFSDSLHYRKGGNSTNCRIKEKLTYDQKAPQLATVDMTLNAFYGPNAQPYLAINPNIKI